MLISSMLIKKESVIFFFIYLIKGTLVLLTFVRKFFLSRSVFRLRFLRYFYAHWKISYS